MRKIKLFRILLITLFLCLGTYAQEDPPFLSYEAPSQNSVKFNRFLINPTFSTVREDKSYINLFHRNQSLSFDDNNQAYYLSYSGRVGDRTGLGLSLYTQREGIFSNAGLLANYAYGIKLSDKSNFTFGVNFSYYTSGFDEARASILDQEDFLLNSLEDSSLVSFQPGFNISYGNFDFGLFANNLIDFNLKTSASNTLFNEKTYSGHLQYTHQFKNGQGIFENARLMPLARARKVGQEDYILGGNLILDLPKFGWLQASYDDFYGAAAGVGFNLSKNISLGYTIEKGLSEEVQNFGATHEISLAYSLTPNLTEDRVMLEKDNEDLALNKEPEVEEISLTEKDTLIAELQQKLAENDAILDELLLRQDSIEKSRESDLERRFNMVMRLVQRETDNNPYLKDKARKAYFEDAKDLGITSTTETNNPISNQGIVNYSPTNKANTLDSANEASTTAIVQTKAAPNTASKNLISLNNNKKTEIATNEIKPYKIARDKIYQPKNVKPSTKVNTRFKSFSIPNVENGHYLIANVYEDETYMNKFLKELNDSGIEADYFESPKNGMKYVYLKQSPSYKEIALLHKSKLNGKFNNPTWVMTVKNTNKNSSGFFDNKLANTGDKNSDYTTKAVTSRTYSLNGVGDGYYIIANVFANTSYAKRFVKKMNSEGLNAGYFINPENNYKYVYLKKHQTWNNALVSYYDKLNDLYDDKMWIMRVKPNAIA